MKHGGALVAVLSLALLGCGGGDDDAGGGADSASNDDAASSGGAGSDWCQTILEIDDDLNQLEEDVDNEDFYDEIADAYRQIANGAPGDLDADFDRVIAGFEAFNDWLQDPSGDYPLSDEEEAEYTASIGRISAAIEQQCGIDIDDSGDDTFEEDAFEDDTFEDDTFEDDTFEDDTFEEEAFAEDSGDGISTQIDNDQGTGTVTIGGQLPDDFPLPTPATFRVGSSSVFEEADTVMYSAVLHAPQADFDAAADLYEAFLGDEGFEVSRDDMSSSDVDRFVLISGLRDGATVDIVMSFEEVGNDDDGNLLYETTITLAWNEDA